MASKSFIKGTLVLVIAGLIVRVFGFVYRIYLSNLIGSEGIGLFQLISPVYSLVILTLTSGVSISVSRLVAREYAHRRYINIRRITLCALAIVLSSGMAVSAVLYFNLEFITSVLIKDTRTYYSMLFLLPCIPVIAATSAIRGFFYGLQDTVPSALSQVAEQMAKIAVVMATAGYMLKMGVEYACAAAVIGMAAGEIAGLAVLLVIYMVKVRKIPRQEGRKGLIRKRNIVKEILSISLPVSFNRFIMSAMGAAEYILIPRMLLAGGLDYTSSIVMYGKLTGMAMPLIYFPGLVTSSMATTLVPAISEAVTLKRYRIANHRINRAIRISVVLGFVFMAVFRTFSTQISDVVYRNEDIGELLHMLSFTCVFTYLRQTMLGVLNGLEKQTLSLRNSMIGNAIRIGFVVFLMPVYGLKSYIAGIIISLAVAVALDLAVVVKNTGIALDLRDWIVKPGIVGIIMILTGRYVFHFFELFIDSYRLASIASVAALIGAGVCLMYASGILSNKKVI
jgi:stage V sporulation protein B